MCTQYLILLLLAHHRQHQLSNASNFRSVDINDIHMFIVCYDGKQYIVGDNSDYCHCVSICTSWHLVSYMKPRHPWTSPQSSPDGSLRLNVSCTVTSHAVYIVVLSNKSKSPEGFIYVLCRNVLSVVSIWKMSQNANLVILQTQILMSNRLKSRVPLNTFMVLWWEIDKGQISLLAILIYIHVYKFVVLL